MRRIALAIAAAGLALQPAGAHQQVPAGLTAPGYQPQSEDERGLWMVMAEEERRTRDSNFVIRDEGLNAYVRQVFCRTIGPECADIRIYLMRTPYFNASMAPNGMMQVWSGLLLRTRDEAQLAAVLAHEYTHYREQHTLRSFRDLRDKASIFSFLSIPLAILGGYGATSAAQMALVSSLFAFSRDMERSADAGSVVLLARAGYDPMAASQVWQDMLAEREATAAARRRRVRAEDVLFSTHPTSRERMGDLAVLAAAQPGGARESGRARYVAALRPHWASLIDDQIKLNDHGATELLLERLAAGNWTPDLLFARAELLRARGRPTDLDHAAGYYRAALAQPEAPAEAHRGLGLALLRRGDGAAGRAALSDYLAARPDAPDAAMLRGMVEG